VEKRIFEIYEEEVDRITIDKSEHKNQFSLNEEQNKAILQIDEAFQLQKPVLLHGITSSGKTLVYTQIIKNIKHQNQQILFLLPEIALTAQLIQRLQNWLGNIAVYHSKLSNSERVETWNKVLKQEIQIIVGARSALLLPFSNLGLIIVDEEHDASYKQQEPNPRYHARDAALMLANRHKANVILGSATPSFESYFNARQNKYQLVELTKRYNDVPLPKIKFINYKNALKEKKIVSGITFELRDKIQDTLNEKKQVVLFQNRRGYAPYLSCKSCDWIPMCKNCDVTLTYHKYTNDLRCHYCGYTETHISHCKACGDNNIEQKGIGTERIEDDLKSIFPDAKIGRMDYDTVKTKYGHEKIIHAFEDGIYDILVGTQMVTKGLDFKNLQLVGVLNADALLYFPDFRAIERAYQLLVQVSGRAGRKD
ncbi:MAG: primosomal protein N', partial [Bacteroidetes bacterium]|nr:primosomal protein N' [Bacteroidota bacterium]